MSACQVCERPVGPWSDVCDSSQCQNVVEEREWQKEEAEERALREAKARAVQSQPIKTFGYEEGRSDYRGGR